MATGVVGRLVGGRFRLDRELDRGPGTQSLLVTDLRNGRPCVLRQLFVAAASPEEARRFEAQAAILAQLDHPGLPRFIAGFSEGEGAAEVRVVVTSYHPGESLERLVAKGRPLTEAQALALLRRIVPVLAYLHAFEPPLVHRTIGATGIILGPDGRPCLTDLDYAVAGPAVPAPEQAPPGPDELALAAPEVFMGGALPASDIYALGLAVCRGMSGKDPAALLRESAKQPLRGALGASEAFAAVIARMLDVSLERRYADAKVLEADLARLAGTRVVPASSSPAAPPRVTPPRAAEAPPASPEAGPRRSVRPLVLAGVVLALLAAAAVAMLQRTRPAPEESLLVSPAPAERSAVPSPAQEPSAPQAAEPAPVTPDSPAVEPAPQADPSTAAPTPQPEPPAPAPAPAGDAAPVVAEGRLLFDGKPFADAAAPAPLFWLRHEPTKTVVKPQIDHAAGAFTVRGLPPGRYAMSVRVNLEPRNPNIFPGDLTGWEEFTLEAGRTASIDVSLRTVMHLVQPADNGAVIPGWDVPCGAGAVSPGIIVFSWDALGPGTSYETSVDRLDCGRAYAPAGRVFSSSAAESWVKVELPPSREGECYSFRLSAKREGRTVGIMSTHGQTGLGWDYRFTVAGR